MRTLIAGCAVALVVLAVGAGAGIEHTILHGVEIGRVRVWVSPDELPGPFQEQLQISAESQLQEAGIEITPDAPALLLVKVDLVSGPGCFAKIDSSLVEDALLERNGHRVAAESWRTGGTVILRPQNDCTQFVPEAVERAVADFIEMHSAMNSSAD